MISGMYVLEHHTLKGYISKFVSVNKDISFDLDLLWGQNTFDGPHQLWRATSDYTYKVSIYLYLLGLCVMDCLLCLNLLSNILLHTGHFA